MSEIVIIVVNHSNEVADLHFNCCSGSDSRSGTGSSFASGSPAETEESSHVEGLDWKGLGKKFYSENGSAAAISRSVAERSDD